MSMMTYVCLYTHITLKCKEEAYKLQIVLVVIYLSSLGQLILTSSLRMKELRHIPCNRNARQTFQQPKLLA